MVLLSQCILKIVLVIAMKLLRMIMKQLKARGVDVVIADTAGRLQNKSNLMEELRKIVRVMKVACWRL